jgi:hypothetical protein
VKVADLWHDDCFIVTVSTLLQKFVTCGREERFCGRYEGKTKENSMSNKKSLLEKIEKDLELAQTKLIDFKAQMTSGTAVVRAENTERIHILQQRIEEAKTRLFELSHLPESVPEQIIDGAEDTWRALQDSLRDAVSTFEGHH